MLKLDTNFTYKGSRTYIHSSSLSELVAEEIVPALGLKLKDVKLDAQFHHVATKNGAIYCHEEAHSDLDTAADFRLAALGKIFYCYFVEEGRAAEKSPNPQYTIENFECTSAYAGTCMIDTSTSLALLENVIEANKRLHLLAAPGKEMKVSNLYMKKFPFEVVDKSAKLSELKIRHIGLRHHKNGIATINELFFTHIPKSTFQMCYYVEVVGA